MNNILIDVNGETTPSEPLIRQTWGFTSFSERLNGRLGMLGFFFLVLIEIITKQKLLDLLT